MLRDLAIAETFDNERRHLAFAVCERLKKPAIDPRVLALKFEPRHELSGEDPGGMSVHHARCAVREAYLHAAREASVSSRKGEELVYAFVRIVDLLHESASGGVEAQVG